MTPAAPAENVAPAPDFRRIIAETWPPDFRAEFPLYVESFERAGHSRAEAEARAFRDWDGPAREAARQDAARARGEAFACAEELSGGPPSENAPTGASVRPPSPGVAAMLAEIAR